MRARHSFLYATALCGLTGLAVGQVSSITAVVKEGDPVAGVGNVTSVADLAVNDGGSWLAELDTDGSNTATDGVVLRDGNLFVREGDALVAPTGASVGSFDSVRLNDAGLVGWNLFLDGLTSSTDSGIFLGTSLLIQESDVSGAPEFSAGTPYIGFFDVKLNDSNQMMVLASTDDPAISSSVDQAFVLLTLDNAGNLVSESAVWKEGDALAGQQVSTFGTGPHSSAFNVNGDLLFVVDLDGASTIDGAVVLNSTALAQEGSPSPISGRNWLSLTTSTKLDLNDNGDHVYAGRLDGDTATDNVIIKNGALFRQEGDSLPDITGFSLTSFGSGPVLIDGAGNVLWFGDWDDANTSQDTGLFLNDTLIVQEGVTLVGGLTVESLSGVEDGYAISENGRWILFECNLTGGLNSVCLIQIDHAPVSYCTAGTTSSGCLATMGSVGTPSLSNAQPFTLTASGVEGTSNGIFFYSIAGRNAAPWGNSTSFLCVKAPTQRMNPPFNSGGTNGACDGSFASDWNAYVAANPMKAINQALAVGSVVGSQAWFRDPPAGTGPVGAKGTALSDALEFVLQP